ncbi:MAG: ribonuclease R [Deltaproteobacteria bacterium]
MKLKKKSVLRLLDEAGDLLSAKQIRGALGLSKSHTPKIRALLAKLVNQGKLIQQGTRFGSRTLISQFQKPRILDSERTRKHFSPKSKTSRREGKRLSGYFNQNRKGFGFVSIGGGEADLFISESDVGSALEGDRVEVELLGARGYRGRRKGRVVSVLERASKHCLARLEKKGSELFAIPLNPRIGLPFISILPTKSMEGAEPGSLVEVELIDSEDEFRMMKGKIIRILEETGNLDLGFEMILRENSIREEFPANAIQEADSFPKRILPHQHPGRVDQRHLAFITIDGKSARDFDDAVFVEKMENGGFRLFVAIADVAHYVTPDSAIDEEAKKRGTSVYFPTHAIPMLPEALSNGLCSLRPGVNRLTLTCEMQLNQDGECIDYRIYESLIKSHARLDYDAVADFLDSGKKSISNKEIQKSLKLMQELMHLLEEKRKRRGAIQFEFSESSVEFDHQNRMTGMSKKFQSSSMKMIEQFMLEANETVARHCVKRKLPALYRVHQPPSDLKLQQLKKTLAHYGVNPKTVSLSDSYGFSRILSHLKELPQFEALQVVLLRSMALAVYQTRNGGHFGLAAEFYTHFTSPIRRYPDLMVHRALKKELSSGNQKKSSRKRNVKQKHGEEIDRELALKCSQQERNAEKAELQSVDLMKCVFLEPHIGVDFQSIIRSLDSRQIRVELEPHTLEWNVPLETLNDDRYFFDKERLYLSGRRQGRLIRIGQRLKLKLIRVDVLQRNIDFDFEGWLN